MATALLVSGGVRAELDVSVSLGLNASRADTPMVGPRDTTLPTGHFGELGHRVFLGIAWADTSAVEIGWSRLGEVSGFHIYPGIVAPCAPLCPGPDPNPPPGPPTFIPAKLTGTALSLAYARSWRSGPLEFKGKLGAARVERKYLVENDVFATESERDTELLLGAGVTHWFNDYFGASLDAEVLGDEAIQLGLSASFRW